MTFDEDNPRNDRPAKHESGNPLVLFTDEARGQILRNMDVEGGERLALRLSAHRISRGDFHYELLFVGKDEREADDAVVTEGELEVFIDPDSAALLRGTVVGFDNDLQRLGFTFDNPNAGWDDPVAQKIQDVLDGKINPAVARHGGVVTLVEVKDGVAHLEMGGGCQGCFKADETLEEGVERMLREAVPEVEEVVDTTDHDAGSNPYFRSGDDGASSPLS